MGNIIQKDLPLIADLLKKVLGKDDYTEIARMGGLTNHTYHVTFADGGEYVVRIPCDGTEEMIVRSDEEKSTRLACDLGVDAKMLYFGKDGSKVTEYLKNAETMSADTIKDPVRIAQVADIFNVMHSCGKDTGVPFEVFDMAAGYEKIIADMQVPMFADFAESTVHLGKAGQHGEQQKAAQKPALQQYSRDKHDGDDETGHYSFSH